MFDTKAILLGLICYGYCFYHIAEKIRYYQEINEDVHNEQENFKLRWTNEMMNKLIDFKDNQISRIITERSRHSWAKGKMVQFYDDFKVRPVELEAANLFIGNRKCWYERQRFGSFYEEEKIRRKIQKTHYQSTRNYFI